MAKFLDGPGPLAVILLALVAVAIAVAIYAIGKVRERVLKKGEAASEMLTNFQQLHSQGELDDEEYRTIKAMLADRLQKELKDSNESG